MTCYFGSKIGEWRASKKQIAGLQAIERSDNSDEVSLVCEHGEIWEASAVRRTFKALVLNHRVANQLTKSLGGDWSYTRGDEAVLTFGEEHLPAVVLALRPLGHPNHQIEKANDFRKPKSRFSAAIASDGSSDPDPQEPGSEGPGGKTEVDPEESGNA